MMSRRNSKMLRADVIYVMEQEFTQNGD